MNTVTNATADRNSRRRVEPELFLTFTLFGGLVAVAACVVLRLIFAKIKATINGDIEKSWTTEYGSEISVDVKPESELRVQYGAMNELVSWMKWYFYSNCDQGQKSNGTAKAPYREKWKIFYQ